MHKTVKTSVSLQKPLWQRLKKEKNKSGLINIALQLYFEREKYLQEADKNYWKKIEASIQGESDEYITLNPNKEPITEDLLEKTLWK